MKTPDKFNLSFVRVRMYLFLIAGLFGFISNTNAVTFATGDVFVGVASGQVQWRSSAGALISTLNTGQGGFTTGMAFDAAHNLYVTNFSANSVSVFNTSGTNTGTFGSGYTTPESIVFDVTGNVYVGNTGNGIRKYDALGNFIATSYGGQTDWMDLASDQCTMLYSTEGTSINQYNVCTNTALAAFATGLGGRAYAMRIRQNGEVILANSGNILRFSSAGALLQTYTVAGENTFFALNLNPDGTSFWSAAFGTANVYKIDIATGNVLTSFNTGTGANTVFGLAVFGEFTASVCANNHPPTFTAPTPTCGSTIQVVVGNTVSFTVAASDVDASSVVTLDATGLPATSTTTPTLPTNGNPVSSTFSWAPTAADAGPHTITFSATDNCAAQVTCAITVNVQCVISVSAGPNEETFYGYLADQTVTHSAVVTGGTAPFSYVWTLSRPLLCNQVNSAGDEYFSSGGVCTNNVCPTIGSLAVAPSCTGGSSITATLMADADVCVVVTDANGCIGRSCFHIKSEDARCFAGNSTNPKVTICHYTGSRTNPTVQICVAQAAVAAHLSTNPYDFVGRCIRLRSASLNSSAGQFPMNVFPNPANNNVTIEFESPSQEAYKLSLYDIAGRSVLNTEGMALEGANSVPLSVTGIAFGIYDLKLTIGDKTSIIRLAISN